MLDRETFAGYVREVLDRLHDRAFLRTHPLAELLALAGQPLSGSAVRSAIDAAIEELKPLPDAPPLSPAWRRYRHLVLRYVEGQSFEETTRRLMISVRQGRRDHAEAVAELTAVLWQRYLRAQSPRGQDDRAMDGQSRLEGSDADESILQAELTKVEGPSEEGPTDLAEALRDAFSTLGGLARTAGVSLDLSAPADLPPVGASRVVLRQILLNFLVGAIKLAPTFRITVSAVRAEERVELRLVLARPAGRAANGQAALPSPGDAEAALAICQRLAKLQGGSVRADAAGGQVASLELVLPAVAPTTVLVVDDNPDVARLFRRYLAAGNYRVIHATNASGALELASETRPDVITLDVLLPSHDGWEILRDLKERPETKDIPVVVCSILPERTLALSLGGDDFVAKPVTREALWTALRRWQRRGR
ncbi:MAG: response regulator [Chloroflexi bacterium]|nr:response regulator [Chloroflexota bacterium]